MVGMSEQHCSRHASELSRIVQPCSNLSTQEREQLLVESAGMLPSGGVGNGGCVILVWGGQDVLKAEGAIAGC